jgi:hypothetical protein
MIFANSSIIDAKGGLIGYVISSKGVMKIIRAGFPGRMPISFNL